MSVETYKVYRDGAVLKEGLTEKAYEDTTVKAATKYKYKVGAVNEAGETLSDEIEITTKAIAVTGLTFKATTGSVEVGKTVAIEATVAPADATNKTVTYKSSDAKVATVDIKGVVTGVDAGTAEITGTTTDGSKTAKFTATVTAPAEG